MVQPSLLFFLSFPGIFNDSGSYRFPPHLGPEPLAFSVPLFLPPSNLMGMNNPHPPTPLRSFPPVSAPDTHLFKTCSPWNTCFHALDPEKVWAATRSLPGLSLALLLFVGLPFTAFFEVLARQKACRPRPSPLPTWNPPCAPPPHNLTATRTYIPLFFSTPTSPLPHDLAPLLQSGFRPCQDPVCTQLLPSF